LSIHSETETKTKVKEIPITTDGITTDGITTDGITTDGITTDGLCCASVTDAPLGEGEAHDLARVLGALADPVRLRLLSLVASRTEICSCDLEGPLGKSQPTVSHHTKVLADAGLLVGEKRGRWMWWRVEPDRLAMVRRALGG
jgi:ArsR family transcriptional regulator, arsenate/arsenite/antimonite-responsive transcriptional repressor